MKSATAKAIAERAVENCRYGCAAGVREIDCNVVIVNVDVGVATVTVDVAYVVTVVIKYDTGF